MDILSRSWCFDPSYWTGAPAEPEPGAPQRCRFCASPAVAKALLREPGLLQGDVLSQEVALCRECLEHGPPDRR